MRSLCGILTILIFSNSIAFGQPDYIQFHSIFEQKAFSNPSSFKILLASDPSIDSLQFELISSQLSETVLKLNQKRKMLSDEKFLEMIFYQVHRKSLKSYQKFVMFSELIKGGAYDCLTGTAYYAVLLDHLGITFTIYEFEYHVLLVAHLHGKDYLFESTDPYHGFIADPSEIAQHLTLHKNNQPTGQSQIGIGQKNVTAGENSLMNMINLQCLTGLQYYNMALEAYNNGDVPLSKSLIEKAALLYPSPRIKTYQLFFSQELLATL